MLRFDEIFQKILDIEDKLKLFEKTIDGVRFWEYVRQPIIATIYELLAGEMSSLIKGPSLRKRIWFLIISIVRLWKNPIFARKKDLLFISSPRRVLRKDGYWWDIYTDYLMEGLNLSHVAIEHNINLEHHNPPRTANLWYFDFQYALIYIAEKLKVFQVSLGNDERALLMKIKEMVDSSFGINIDLRRLVLRHLGYRRIRIPYFQFVLKRIRPRAIILLTSYGKEDLIEVAKSWNIPVIEIQHGVISRFHSGYSFPGEKRKKMTFPDWLFTFGDFWTHGISYTIDDSHVVSTGFPYLDEERKAFSNIRKKKQILVISQWTIGDKLSMFIAELSKVKNLDYKIVYKLHPLEYKGWQKKYPWLNDTDIDVIQDLKTSLYQLFAESEIQIGIYSTAVFEGLAFGLKTFIVDIPGADYPRELIEEGVAVKVSNVEELVHHLKENQNFQQFDSERFFRSGAKKRMIDLILEIISK